MFQDHTTNNKPIYFEEREKRKKWVKDFMNVNHELKLKQKLLSNFAYTIQPSLIIHWPSNQWKP